MDWIWLLFEPWIYLILGALAFAVVLVSVARWGAAKEENNVGPAAQDDPPPQGMPAASAAGWAAGLDLQTNRGWKPESRLIAEPPSYDELMDAIDGARPVGWSEVLKLVRSARAIWAPEWIKVNSDRVAVDRLIETLRRADEKNPPERVPTLPLNPIHALTGIPIVYDDAILSGLMLFIDESGNPVFLDLREDGKRNAT